MKKIFAFLMMCAFLAVLSVSAQTKIGSSLSSPLATVKLTKTEVISEKVFREDIQKLEEINGRTLSKDEKQSYLDNAINEILFKQMCERDGYKVSDGEVSSYIKQVRVQQRPQGETDAQFEAFLKSQGSSLKALTDNLKNQMLVQKWIMSAKADEIKNLKPVTANDILKFYDNNKSQLIRPDTVKLAYLLCPKNQKDIPDPEGKIKELYKKLQKGESFDVLRLQASTNGYVANPDFVYFMKRSDYVQRFGQKFNDIAFMIKDGSYSEVFENDIGWWIVKRVEFYPQKQLELSDPIELGNKVTVQDYINQGLSEQKQNEFIQKAFSDLYASLRKQADIKINGTL